MNPSYLVRLLLLSSASFFLVQLIIAALIALVAPAAIRYTDTMRPQRAARFLLALRLLPAVFSALAVAALCFPSYLLFEPHVAGEEVGIACLCAAILGAFVCSVALYRALSALIRSRLYLRGCAGLESRVDGETVWIVPENAGVAMAGIVHPRLLISKRAMNEFSADELAVALRHEHAHRLSRDNFKRLLILLAPPIFSPLCALEQAWAKFAEWAADDRATEGDADRSLSLAAALVRVARLQSGVQMPALVTSLVETDEDLTLRVNRLLHPSPVSKPSIRAEAIALAGIAFLIGAVATNQGSLRFVHQLLERMLD
jgi:beta-lactamase regulating signal transducer with metallopeptidase domain